MNHLIKVHKKFTEIDKQKSFEFVLMGVSTFTPKKRYSALQFQGSDLKIEIQYFE